VLDPAPRDLARRAARALQPHRRWLVVWLLLGLWFAHPLWSARLLPLHDLPNHLARITALHYLSDPRWHLAPFYQRSLQPVPYLGHYYLVHLLTYVTRSVTVANLLFMVAYVVATPLCGWSFARASGRSPWLAFLLLPLSVSLFFQWGFIAYCAGAMLLLPALAALFRLLDEPSRGRALAVGLWCAALYLFHIVPWASFGLLALVLVALELGARRWRGPLLASLAMAPSLGLMAVGLLQARHIGYLGRQAYDAQRDTPTKLLSRATSLFDWWKSETLDDWVLLALVLVVVVLAVTDGGNDAGEPWRRRLRIPLAFVLFVTLAALTPFWIKQPFNWWMVNERFLLPAACVAVFLPRGALRGGRAWLLGAALGLMALLPPAMARHYRDFSRRAAPIVDLIQATPLGANTLMLHTPGRPFDDPFLAPQMTMWRELYNYPLVYRGGYDPYLYDDGFPVRRIASLPAPKVPRAAETIRSPDETHFHPESQMRGWDYFLVSDDNVGAMPADGAVAVQKRGEWTLYRNVLP
jgi:hypothetical protein